MPGRALFLISLTCAAAPLAAQSRSQIADISWGKAGVSFDDYRADAIACAVEAVNLDIADTRAARRLVAASRALEASDNQTGATPATIDPRSGPASGSPISLGADYARQRDVYQPDRQFTAIGELQQQTLDNCLARRGYSPFRLTREQKSHLRQMDRGSDVRRHYLHSLAANAEVLRTQALGGEATVTQENENPRR